MRVRNVVLSLLLALLSGLECTAFAAQPTRLPSNKLSNSILSLAQDRDGFIWIGTSEGLLRYDGYSYGYLREEKGNPLASSRIRCIVPDSSGRLWVGTETQTVVYDPSSLDFKTVESPAGGQAVRAIIGIPGDMFAICSTKGIDLVDGGTLESRFFPADGAHPYFAGRHVPVSDDNGTIWMSDRNALVRMTPACPGQEPELKTWKTPYEIILRSIDGGRMYYTVQNGDLRVAAMPEEEEEAFVPEGVTIVSGKDVRSVSVDGEDVVVVTSYGGISCFHMDTGGRPVHTRSFWLNESDRTDISNGIQCALRDNDGNMFYGSAGGLFAEWHNANPDIRTISGGGGENMLHNIISDVLTTDGETVWAAGGQGLDELRFRGGHYEVFHHALPADLTDNASLSRLQCLAAGPDGLLYIGTKSTLLTYDLGKGKYSVPQSLDDFLVVKGADFCKSVYWFGGRLWMGFVSGGLFVYDPGLQKCSRVLFSGEDLSGCSVFKVRSDSCGRICIATNNRGVYSFSPDGLTPVGDVVIVEDFRHCSLPEPAPVYDIFRTRSGAMLVCTPDGIYELLEDGTSSTLIDAMISANSIVEDNGGNLWMSSQSGLYVSDENFNRTAFFGVNESNFSYMHYNTGSCALSDGTLVFGGISGLTYLDPEAVVASRKPHKVNISGAYVMGRRIPLPEDGVFRLKYNEYQFSLAFSTLTYPADLSRIYYYRVKESGDRWIPLKDNTLVFSNFSPGSYTLGISGEENPAPDSFVSFRVVVSPPWWKTWWAYLSYFLLSASIIALLLSFLLNKYRSDYQLRTLINVTHGFKTPLTLMKVPLSLLKQSGASDGNLLSLIEHNVLKLSDTVNQLLEFRKVDKHRAHLNLCRVDLTDMVSSIADLFGPLFETRRISFNADIPQGPVAFVCDPDKIELILFNILQNAYKFTPEGGSVSFSFQASADAVTMTVKDSGCGIDPKFHKKVFERFWQYSENGSLPSRGAGIGLSLAQEFTRMHSGRIKLESRSGEGASFSIVLPYLKDSAVSGQEVVKVEPEYVKQFASGVEEQGCPEPLPGTAGTKILVASGESDMVGLLAKILPEYSLSYTGNLEEAYRMVTSGRPDILVINLDNECRDRSFGLCRRLKSNFETRDIPVVYLTDSDSPQEAKLYYELGADSHISKPFDPGLLKARINQLVNKHLNIREKIKVEKIIVSSKELDIESADESFLKKAMEVVEAAIPDESFTLVDFAGRMNVSKTVLNGKIRSLAGRSPMELLSNARMQRAAQLLSSGAYNVSQVCFMTGYSDPRYFATCFKKAYGCTPSSYIASHAKRP